MRTEPERTVAGYRIAGYRIAGYCIDELVGVGERSNVYRASSVADGGRSAVVIKVCAEADDGARALECRVLGARPVPQMPRLIEVAETARGECAIVMSVCPGRTLRSLQARRADGQRVRERPPSRSGVRRGRRGGSAGRRRGEPFGLDDVDGGPVVREGALAALLASLHAAGVAHGSLDADAILVDDGGELSLVGFAQARERGDPGFEAAVAGDRRAARRLEAALCALDRVDRSRAHAEQAHAARAHATQAHAAEHPRPGAIEGLDEEDPWDWTPDPGDEGVQAEPMLLEVLEPAAMALRECWHAVRSLARSRSRAVLRPRRRRGLLLIGSVLLIGTIVACALLPGRESAGSQSAGAGAGSSATTAPETAGLRSAGPQSDGPQSGGSQSAQAPSSGSGAPESARPTAGTATVDAALRPTDAAPPPTESSQSDEAAAPGDNGSPGAVDPPGGNANAADSTGAATTGDDPVVAGQAVLGLRRGCIARHEPSCLDGVVEWGSPAAVVDHERARAGGLPQRADPLAEVVELQVVQRLGGVAVLRGLAPPGAADTAGSDANGTGAAGAAGTKKPVSLLMVRTETGWRLRWYDSG
ncbi:hypothetical protein [Herbiconiux daphne]|uniref:Protein kinase domain-containing protein n=1 Tax=Herbiconiux daphne TaxID=2970914 RepID=A0ABT2H1P5_9MICO|nr:hypothetical protein [Herbiconiux daphne]MCS5733835.1 hypothetical protein [Herbiconiux daphne]